MDDDAGGQSDTCSRWRDIGKRADAAAYDGNGQVVRSGSPVLYNSEDHKAAERQKIFIVCKTPKDVRRLIEGGVPIKEVNVGNMHFSQGKHQISKKVYVDDADLADLKAIRDAGVDLYIQDVPGDIKERIKEI